MVLKSDGLVLEVPGAPGMEVQVLIVHRIRHGSPRTNHRSPVSDPCALELVKAIAGASIAPRPANVHFIAIARSSGKNANRMVPVIVNVGMDSVIHVENIMAQTLPNCKLLVQLNALAPLELRSTIALVRVVRMTVQNSFLANAIAANLIPGKSCNQDNNNNCYDTSFFDVIHMNELEKWWCLWDSNPQPTT